MKTIASFFAVAALLAAPAAQANNILIYKVVQTSNDLYTDVTNPNTAPKGYAAKTYVSTDTYYMVMDLTTGTTVPNSSGNIVEIGVSSYSTAYAAYDSAGKSIAVGSKKLIFIQPTSPLSDYFGPLQPLKLANNYLWSVQSGINSKIAYDYDDIGSKESFDTYFASRHLKGIGTPLV
ncbi:MAG: hypothetical protein JWO89_3255, partial [Verrucomicrobiaceae bacterium]|nr:hypothetical protein [Verrucomicrobiaceae bacterium]